MVTASHDAQNYHHNSMSFSSITNNVELLLLFSWAISWDICGNAYVIIIMIRPAALTKDVLKSIFARIHFIRYSAANSNISKVCLKSSGHFNGNSFLSCPGLFFSSCQSYMISLPYDCISVHYCHYLSLIYSNIKQPDPI